MNTRSQVCSQDAAGTFRWSVRILALGLAGIFFLTLYPFRFAIPRSSASPGWPFLLGGFEKTFSPFAIFLNVLLFIPFGFGLAAQIRKRGSGHLETAFLTYAAGALLSYAIEFLQLFVPGRESGWSDIITNSFGAFLGAIAFRFSGIGLLRLLRNSEKALEAHRTTRNLTVALLLYFGLWFGISARLQQEARLSGWKSDAILIVGNSPRGQLASAWKGEIYSLEFWDHALPGRIARRVTASGNTTSARPGLATYEFSASPPFLDQNRFLPDLEWVSPRTTATIAGDPPAVWNGVSWAATGAPVAALVANIEKTGQFSVRVRCKPFQVTRVSAGIVSVAEPGGAANLGIWQDNESVGFWFRTPLTVSRPELALHVPKIFIPNQSRDFVFSYDGSNASLTIDGRQIGSAHYLGPGTALARFVRRINTQELQGYRYIFYALVFFPAGSLLALGGREHPGQVASRLPITFAGLVLPPILLELFLAHLGRQSISFENIGLAFAALLLGAAWINIGGTARPDPSQLHVQASES